MLPEDHNPQIDDEKPKRQLIKERLIDNIMTNHEPDQILIDILRTDLYYLAEIELNKLNEDELLDIVLEN